LRDDGIGDGPDPGSHWRAHPTLPDPGPLADEQGVAGAVGNVGHSDLAVAEQDAGRAVAGIRVARDLVDAGHADVVAERHVADGAARTVADRGGEAGRAVRGTEEALETGYASLGVGGVGNVLGEVDLAVQGVLFEIRQQVRTPAPARPQARAIR